MGLFLLAALLGPAPASAQSCTVIHVRGSVGLASSEGTGQNATLAPGDTFAPTDTLQFASPNDRALALCPAEGRVLVRPQHSSAAMSTSRSSSEVWVAVVSTVLMDPISQRQLNTRGAPRPDTLRTPLDVRRHFGVPRYLMLGVHEVPVAGALRHRLATGARLVLGSVGGEKTRELRVTGGHLRIVPDTLMGLLGTPEERGVASHSLTPPVMLRWVSADEARLLAAVRPVAPPPAQVAREVRALMGALRTQARTPDDVRREVYGFLQDAYGTPYLPHTEAWLESHLDL